MAKAVSANDVRVALKQIGTVYFGEREANLLGGYEEEVAKFVNDFLTAHPDFEFVGLPYLTESQRHLALDGAHPSFYKDSTTLDWAITPTGQGTFDNIFPETGSQRIYLITNTIPHWALLAGFLEVGSSANLMRIDYKDINGKIRGRMVRHIQSRIGDIRLVKMGPAIVFPDRGVFDIDMEFETASEAEIIPLAVHVVPYEVLRSDYATKNVVDNAT